MFEEFHGRVVMEGGEVYRTLSPSARSMMEEFLKLPPVQQRMASGSIIPTKRLSHPTLGEVLHHDRLDLVTYPYEWSFQMLKDAALLTLSIMDMCLDHGFILKDGSSFNVTFHKGQMCFFDVLSVGKYQKGQVWYGYVQFCEEFLYPLMMKAYKKYHYFAPLPLDQIRHLWSWADLMKPGVCRHILLQSFFSKSKTLEKESLKKSVHIPVQVLKGLVKNLREIIQGLSIQGLTSTWSGYEGHNTYDDQNRSIKSTVIDEFSRSLSGGVVVDLGANGGEFSVIAAKHGRVISCDLDPQAVDVLYQRAKIHPIYPVVQDIMNPSAHMGFLLEERSSLFDRVKGQGFLALALIHHLCIAKNVPLEFFVTFLKRVAPSGVVEWVGKSDPMVQFLLRNREDIFPNYTKEAFEQVLSQHFTIEEQVNVNDNHRTLYVVRS